LVTGSPSAAPLASRSHRLRPGHENDALSSAIARRASTPSRSAAEQRSAQPAGSVVAQRREELDLDQVSGACERGPIGTSREFHVPAIRDDRDSVLLGWFLVVIGRSPCSARLIP
jgi:hypothetical protein